MQQRINKGTAPRITPSLAFTIRGLEPKILLFTILKSGIFINIYKYSNTIR